MTKKDLARIFGSKAAAGRALRVTRQAIQAWPDVLPQNYVDRVIGAAYRLDIDIPQDILDITKKL